MPFGIGCLLLKNGQFLKKAMCLQDKSARLDFLYDNSLMHYTCELSRPSRALPIWFSLRLLGLKTIKLFIQEKIDLAVHLHEAISRNKALMVEPVAPPELPIVLFRYAGGAYVDEKTMNLLRRINAEARLYLHHAVLSNGRVWIRVALTGYRTHAKHVQILLELINKHI